MLPFFYNVRKKEGWKLPETVVTVSPPPPPGSPVHSKNLTQVLNPLLILPIRVSSAQRYSRFLHLFRSLSCTWNVDFLLCIANKMSYSTLQRSNIGPDWSTGIDVWLSAESAAIVVQDRFHFLVLKRIFFWSEQTGSNTGSSVLFAAADIMR